MKSILREAGSWEHWQRGECQCVRVRALGSWQGGNKLDKAEPQWLDYKGTASRWSELPAANSDFQVASDGFLEYLASTGTETFEAPSNSLWPICREVSAFPCNWSAWLDPWTACDGCRTANNARYAVHRGGFGGDVRPRLGRFWGDVCAFSEWQVADFRGFCWPPICVKGC